MEFWEIPLGIHGAEKSEFLRFSFYSTIKSSGITVLDEEIVLECVRVHPLFVCIISTFLTLLVS